MTNSSTPWTFTEERGYSKHPDYSIWASIKQRCLNPNNTRYRSYGGRGIKVCERWMSFGNFMTDMGPRPSKKHSVDRIDVDGNYEPSNCRWATAFEQSQNRRISSKRIYIDQSNTKHVIPTGVHKRHRKGRVIWIARMNINGKQVLKRQSVSFEKAVSYRLDAEAKHLHT